MDIKETEVLFLHNVVSASGDLERILQREICKVSCVEVAHTDLNRQLNKMCFMYEAASKTTIILLACVYKKTIT